MAFTFPTSPTVGQIFSSGNVAWQWDGQAWRGTSTSGINFLRTDQSGTVSGTLTVTEIIETSSIALKENVRPIEHSFDILENLKGVIYDRKDGSRKDEPGLIAEDVNQYLPNLVSTKDGIIEGISYTRLIAYLIEAVKELKTELEVLKSKKR
jgi:hypothetical protein